MSTQKNPAWVPVTSSALSHVAYDPEAKELHVRFSGGEEYTYAGVPAAEHSRLIAADSVGSHFTKHIRPAYKFSKRGK